jgi:hypothetical protein
MPERIEVKPISLDTILRDIKKGLLKIPRFQREVVWELSDSVDLLDSIYRGFPIGSIVTWETWDKLTDVRSIGDIDLPLPEKGHIPSYVLDGQQRLTSIYACAYEANVISKKRKSPVKYLAWFDLDKRCFSNIKPLNGVTFRQLIATNYDEYRDPLQPQFRSIFSEVRKQLLEEYRFPVIVVRERSMEDACIIFERINNSGRKLTIFDLLVAKAYPLQFDLREEWKKLDRELQAYSGTNPILPMQALSLLNVKLEQDKSASNDAERYGCHKRHLLALPAATIKAEWQNLKACVKLSVDFLISGVGVPTAKLIPYEAPIVLLTVFFLLNNKYAPTGNQSKLLKEYFWSSCISSRYAGSPESNLEEDAIGIREIQKGKRYIWKWATPISTQNILNARYDRRDATVQTILCLLASQRPRSFKSDTVIPIAKEFSQFNAAELHHIFPRGWLKNTKNASWIQQENSLANICLSPSREQRHEIGKKPPSIYLGIFEKNNENLSSTLESHFMGGRLFPLLEKNLFQEFIQQRAILLAKKLNENGNISENQKNQ